MATTPQTQVIWTRCTEICEPWSSCATGNSQISPLGTGTAGKGMKHTFPTLTPPSLQLLSLPSLQSFHAAGIGSCLLHKGRMGTRGRAAVTALCHSPGQSSMEQPGQHLEHRHSSTGPIIPTAPKHSINSAISAVNTSWKVPLMMCQNKSVMCNSTD